MLSTKLHCRDSQASCESYRRIAWFKMDRPVRELSCIGQMLKMDRPVRELSCIEKGPQLSLMHRAARSDGALLPRIYRSSFGLILYVEKYTMGVWPVRQNVHSTVLYIRQRNSRGIRVCSQEPVVSLASGSLYARVTTALCLGSDAGIRTRQPARQAVHRAWACRNLDACSQCAMQGRLPNDKDPQALLNAATTLGCARDTVALLRARSVDALERINCGGTNVGEAGGYSVTTVFQARSIRRIVLRTRCGM